MKLRKSQETRLKAKKLGATEDRVGDRTGPGAGFDLSKGAKEDKRGRGPGRKAVAKRSRQGVVSS